MNWSIGSAFNGLLHFVELALRRIGGWGFGCGSKGGRHGSGLAEDIGRLTALMSSRTRLRPVLLSLLRSVNHPMPSASDTRVGEGAGHAPSGRRCSPMQTQAGGRSSPWKVTHHRSMPCPPTHPPGRLTIGVLTSAGTSPPVNRSRFFLLQIDIPHVDLGASTPLQDRGSPFIFAAPFAASATDCPRLSTALCNG